VYNRVQRLINIKIAKPFQTTSNKALCTLTGLTPIVIKAEEAAKLYNIVRKSQVHEIDHEVQPKTGFIQPNQSEILNNKTSMLHKYLQAAARASMGSNQEQQYLSRVN
jgi:hypothetical protein